MRPMKRLITSPNLRKGFAVFRSIFYLYILRLPGSNLEES